MTQTTPQDNKSPLSPEGQKLAFTVANIVYDDQGVQMIQQALQNTKSKEAIVPQVALAAGTILHKMQTQLDQLPEKEVWGKMGVVHLCLGSIFEVAKHLGYFVPESGLKQAYEIVENILQGKQEQEGPQEDAQEPGEEMPQQQGMQQGAPQGPPPNMMQQAAMMGGG